MVDLFVQLQRLNISIISINVRNEKASDKDEEVEEREDHEWSCSSWWAAATADQHHPIKAPKVNHLQGQCTVGARSTERFLEYQD